MTAPRPPSADDYEIISFRVPRKLCLAVRIKEAAKASGEQREAFLVARIRSSLGVAEGTNYGRRG